LGKVLSSERQRNRPGEPTRLRLRKYRTALQTRRPQNLFHLQKDNRANSCRTAENLVSVSVGVFHRPKRRIASFFLVGIEQRIRGLPIYYTSQFPRQVMSPLQPNVQPTIATDLSVFMPVT
jgi:hypothetical protein